MVSSSWTATVPGRQTRDRSFRIRSTIMMFSAASFAEARNVAAPSFAPRGAVPLIGAVSTVRSLIRKKSSGLKLVIMRAEPWLSGPVIKPPKAGCNCSLNWPKTTGALAAELSMQPDTEIQLVEAAMGYPADHVLHGSEIAISRGLGIRRDTEGSNVR